MDLQLDVDGRLVNIELQLGHAKEYRERSLFYLCRMATSAGMQGEDYGGFPPVISIHIVDFLLFPEREAYHSTFKMCELGDKIVLSHNLRLDYLELRKVQPLPRGRETNDRKLLWMSFFKMRTEEDMNMMYQVEDPVLRKAVEELRKTTTEQKYQATLLTVEKFERDQKIALNRALAEGRAEGKSEGKAEGRAEGQALATAAMVAMRYPNSPTSVLDIIGQYTDSAILTKIGRALFGTATLEEFLSAIGHAEQS